MGLPLINWQRRRTALNHDWLKNRFLTALDAAENILSGRVRGEAYLTYLVNHELVGWEPRRHEIVQLLESFEPQMSPGVLFEIEPLSGATAETRECFQSVIHLLWLGRHPVRNWIESAQNAYARADEAYVRLRCLTRTSTTGTNGGEVIVAFSEFRRCCHILAKSLEAFPNAILAI